MLIVFVYSPIVKAFIVDDAKVVLPFIDFCLCCEREGESLASRNFYSWKGEPFWLVNLLIAETYQCVHSNCSPEYVIEGKQPR